MLLLFLFSSGHGQKYQSWRNIDSLASFTCCPVRRCSTRSLLEAARLKDFASLEALQSSISPCLLGAVGLQHKQHRHRQEQAQDSSVLSNGKRATGVRGALDLPPPLLPPYLESHISRPTPPPPSPARPSCLLSLSRSYGQRCVLGARHRRRHRAVCHAAAQVLTISGDVHGGNNGEPACEGDAGAWGRDDALPIHARPGQGEHGLPGAACGGCLRCAGERAFYCSWPSLL